MKLNKLAIALVAASAGIFGFSSIASAGEGGAAAAASFSIHDGNVTGAAVGAAVGKNNAAATATNDGYYQTNTASALGSAGKVGVATINDGFTTGTFIYGGVDNHVDSTQHNRLDSDVTTPIGTINQ